LHDCGFTAVEIFDPFELSIKNFKMMHEFFRQQWQALSSSLGFDIGSTFNQSFGSQSDTD